VVTMAVVMVHGGWMSAPTTQHDNDG